MKRLLVILSGVLVFLLLTVLYAFFWPNRPSTPMGVLKEIGAFLFAGLSFLASIIEIWNRVERQKEAALLKQKNSVAATQLSAPHRSILPKFSNRIVPEPDTQPKTPPARPLPQGSFVPYSDTSRFLDRTSDLKRIKSLLPKSPVVVCGTAGIGKTSLALEFCYRYGNQYQGVYWLQIPQEMDNLPWHKSRRHTEQKRQSLTVAIARCGRKMGLFKRHKDLAKQAAMTLNAWNDSFKILIVIDNLNNSQVLREFIRQVHTAEILITSVKNDWPADLATIYSLRELDQRYSIQLLRNVAPRLKRFSEKELLPLAKRLGYVPLALDLAGRYLQFFSVMTVTEYMDRLAAKGIPRRDSWRLIGQGSPMHIARLVETIGVSQESLFKTEKVEDRVASDIFLAAGYCMPNSPIPLELLVKCVWHDQDDEFLRGLEKLYKLGMLELSVHPDRWPIQHPFLAEMARIADRRYNEKYLSKIVSVALGICHKACDDYKLSDLLPISPHLQSMAEWAQYSNKINKSDVGALWYYRGNILDEAGDKDETATCYELSIRSYEDSIAKSSGDGAPQDDKLARDHYNLSLVYEAAERCDKALQQINVAMRLEASQPVPDPKFMKLLKQTKARLQ